MATRPMTTDPWGLDGGTLDFAANRRRRRKKLGGWRQLKTGAWQYRVRGIRPNGAPFIIAQTCEDHQKELVELQCKRLAEDYRAGLSSPARQITLLKWQRECVRAGFAWSKQNASTWLVLRKLHAHRLESIDLIAIQKWVTSVLYRGKGRPPKGKAGPGYLRHAFELLRRLMKRAVAMRVLANCPWGDETPPSIPRYITAHKKREPIPDVALQRILDASRTRHPSIWIRIMLSAETGSRPHELSRAKRSWIMPVNEVVGSPQIDGAGILCLPGAKGGYPHDVPLSPQCYSEYKSWYDSLPAQARDTGLLVPVLVRGRWVPARKWLSPTAWKSILRLAGISEPYVLYQLRHTRLAHIANLEGCGPRIAQAIAGHTSVVTTERYTGKARGLVPNAFASMVAPQPAPPEPTTPRPSRRKGNVLSARVAREHEAKRSAVDAVKLCATNVPPEDLYRILGELVDALKTTLKPVVSAPSQPTPTETAILPRISPKYASKESN